MIYPRRDLSVFVLLIILLLLASACTKVGPDFVRPEATVPPGWMETGDKRVGREAVDYRNWWQVFNDPVLNRLIERAYRENLSLRIAGVRVLEARAQLGIAVGEFFPQTQQASGNLQYNRVSERSPAALALSSFTYSQAQIGVGASWELDFWGKFRRAIESANAAWLATVADYDSVLVSLTADVAGTYVLIRTLEKRIEIARQNVEAQKEGLKIAEARFAYGTTTQLDVEQAQTVLNNTRASIPSLETQVRQARNSLCLLLGLPPSDISDLLAGVTDIPVSPLQVAVGIPADLLRRRPDIRSAEQQAAAQSALIGVAKAELYPAFSLSGFFGFLSSDVGNFKLGDIFLWQSRTFQIGPSLRWNFLNYGQITNNVRVQDARLEQLLVAYQNAVLKAQQEVEDSLVAFLRAQERAEFLGRSTASAKNSFDLALLQYREGTKDFTTVLAAQQALLAEQDNLAVTLGNISGSLVGVYRALGGGWEMREGRDLVPPEVKEAMARRTNWGGLLAPASYNPAIAPEPAPRVRFPDW
jgi:NodT family efflux transporter outer membrane factor (OMF) lipoprotein